DLAAALYDFGFEVVAYFNDAEDEQGNPLKITGNLPYKDLPSLGAYADVDFEKMVELGIDLFVAPTWDLSSGYVWPFDEDTLTKIREITPVAVIALSDGADTRRTIEAIGSIATALGADADAPAVQEARAAFETAATELESALAEKPGLTTLFVSPDTDGFWLADNYSDITFFQRLGMRVLAATAGVTAAISWEQFPLWQADLIFMDDRWPNLDELAALVPVYKEHPAVKAGQVVPWQLLYVPSYQGFTPILHEVTEDVQAAQGGLFG
ncbi:MAG: ABC transporter substrate-binding protein, partial [Thermomicrobiales bacterium]